MNEKWATFTKKINVRAPVDILYKAWTTQEGLESWFLRSAITTKADGSIRARDESFQSGDHFHWMWHGYSDEVYEKREVLQANGKDYLQFMFTDECDVEVHLNRIADGQVIVELTQNNIPIEEDPKKNLYVGCGEGWLFYMTNLKSIMEGGIDLRNKDLHLSGLMNA